jgi:hypothetical protein
VFVRLTTVLQHSTSSNGSASRQSEPHPPPPSSRKATIVPSQAIGSLLPAVHVDLQSHGEVSSQVRGKVMSFCQDTDYQVWTVLAWRI